MAGTAELEALLGELKPILASAGVDTTAPKRRKLRGPIAEVEKRLAQDGLSLHRHIRWLWENWPPLACDVIHPGFTNPEFALDALNDPGHSAIPMLMPIGYRSHQDLLVDVTQATAGPYIYVHDYFDDHGIRLVFAGVADLLRYLVTVAEDGDPEANHFDFVQQRERLSGLLPTSVPEEERRPIQIDVTSWPKRWRDHQGLSDGAGAVRGPTHTVAELFAARKRGPVEATVVGRLNNLAGSANGTLARLTDHTGAVDVLIAPTVPRFGESSSGTYELDVIADMWTDREPTTSDFDDDRAEIQRLALEGRIAEAAQAAGPLGHHIGGEHPVRALAQRPVD